MDAETSRLLTDERGRWIVNARASGASLKSIAAALDITPARVAAILHHRLGKARKGEPRVDAMLRKAGLTAGNVRQAISALPQRDQKRLADLAAAREMTAAQALCEYFKGTQ